MYLMHTLPACVRWTLGAPCLCGAHAQEGIIALLAQVSGDTVDGRVTKAEIEAMNEGQGAAYVRDAMIRITGREVVGRVPGDKGMLAKVLPRV